MPKYTERDLQQAVREVHQGTSQRSAAKRWHIPRATLQDRLNGGISHAEAHECRQRFSRQQETLLSRWISELAALGVPPTQGQFEEFASRILVVHGDTQPLGKHWVQGFLRRNSDVKLVKGFLFASYPSSDSDDASSEPSHQSQQMQIEEPRTKPSEQQPDMFQVDMSEWDHFIDDQPLFFDGDDLVDWIKSEAACLDDYNFSLSA